LAIVANVGSPASALESGEVQTAARALGLEVTTVEIRRAEDITPAFEAIEGRADALYVPTEALVLTNRVRINTMALGACGAPEVGHHRRAPGGNSPKIETEN
jgi:ABC-type uncharacterized transport system substrate-binding protein